MVVNKLNNTHMLVGEYTIQTKWGVLVQAYCFGTQKVLASLVVLLLSAACIIHQ